MAVELHFHLLPGVDDGPRDDEEALALARAAVADGTGLIVATPHAGFVDVATLDARAAELGALLRSSRVPLEVRAGAELLAGDLLRLDPRELELVAHGPPGHRWVLLEAPLEGGLGTVPEALAKLSALGYGVLLAHPERSPGWWSDGALDKALRAGARLQVNASSLLGAHGAQAELRALALVQAGHATVLSSDAHSPARPPCLTPALEALTRAGVPADALVNAGPAALLEHGLPPVTEAPLGAAA
jgi:protein-tyrosine phosphatase